MMNEKDADRLEAAMQETLGINNDEAITAHAIVVELQRLRSFNPKLFQTAMLLLMSTLIAAGDKMCPTTGADLAAKLERMVGLESELHRLLDAEKAEQKAAIDRLLGGLLGESGEDDAVIPPSKIN